MGEITAKKYNNGYNPYEFTHTLYHKKPTFVTNLLTIN